MIVERPNFNGFKVIELFVAIAGLRWPWNCLIDQAYLSSGETIGKNRHHANTCNASVGLGPTRGKLHGSHGRASLQRRDRSDPAADYDFAGLEPGASRRPGFCSDVDGGCRQLSFGIFG